MKTVCTLTNLHRGWLSFIAVLFFLTGCQSAAQTQENYPLKDLKNKSLLRLTKIGVPHKTSILTPDQSASGKIARLPYVTTSSPTRPLAAT